MARPCSICCHPQRQEIEALLLQGTSLREVARTRNVSRAALARHKQKHLTQTASTIAMGEETARPQISENQVPHDRRQALDVFQQLRAINAASLEVLSKARAGDNAAALLRAVDRIHRQIQLQARLLGDLEESKTVDIVSLPEWRELRGVILEALRPFPEARWALAAALKEVGA